MKFQQEKYKGLKMLQKLLDWLYDASLTFKERLFVFFGVGGLCISYKIVTKARHVMSSC